MLLAQVEIAITFLENSLAMYIKTIHVLYICIKCLSWQFLKYQDLRNELNVLQ